MPSAVLPGLEFFPRSGDFALVLGNSVRVWGVLALALKFLCSLFPWIFELFPWQLWGCGHLAPSGCPALRASLAVAGLVNFCCEFHPWLCLRGVMFSVWVHSYAVGLCHPFVCGVCGVFRAAQVF